MIKYLFPLVNIFRIRIFYSLNNKSGHNDDQITQLKLYITYFRVFSIKLYSILQKNLIFKSHLFRKILKPHRLTSITLLYQTLCV